MTKDSFKAIEIYGMTNDDEPDEDIRRYISLEEINWYRKERSLPELRGEFSEYEMFDAASDYAEGFYGDETSYAKIAQTY